MRWVDMVSLPVQRTYVGMDAVSKILSTQTPKVTAAPPGFALDVLAHFDIDRRRFLDWSLLRQDDRPVALLLRGGREGDDDYELVKPWTDDSWYDFLRRIDQSPALTNTIFVHPEQRRSFRIQGIHHKSLQDCTAEAGVCALPPEDRCPHARVLDSAWFALQSPEGDDDLPALMRYECDGATSWQQCSYAFPMLALLPDMQRHAILHELARALCNRFSVGGCRCLLRGFSRIDFYGESEQHLCESEQGFRSRIERDRSLASTGEIVQIAVDLLTETQSYLEAHRWIADFVRQHASAPTLLELSKRQGTGAP